VRLRKCIPLCAWAWIGLAAACGRGEDPATAARRYLESGDRYADRQQFKEAVIEYRNAVKAQPALAEGHARLGRTYLKLGQVAEAYGALSRAADLQPTNAAAQLEAGSLQAGAGDFEGARTRAELALKADPRNADAYILMATALAGLQKLDEAIAQAERATRVDPSHAPSFTALGALQLARGKRDEALREFTLAQKDGAVALGQLGAANIALASGRRDDAERLFTTVRDSGTPDEAAAATYGLAVVAFAKGSLRDFKAPAQAALSGLPSGAAGVSRGAPLLYALTAIAVEDKDWPGALSTARRLVNDYPNADVAPDALERVGAGAAAAGAWPTALESTKLLRDRYPQHPLAQGAWLRLAEAQINTGRPAEARQALEQYVAGSPKDADASRAWLALARVREAAGDRKGAIEAYSHGPRDTNGSGWTRELQLNHARLLVQEKRWDAARPILERLLKGSEGAAAADVAFSLGETYSGEGDTQAAVEYYLSAAYVAPDSPSGRSGLLQAARAFAANRQSDMATSAYKKLLAQSDLPVAVRDAARKELAALPRAAP
jgi:tetratricopeptide (TPR) repeat protein